MLGKEVDLNAYTEKFVEITDYYPLLPNEKIVDVAAGKQFIVVVTDTGRVYGSGNGLYRDIPGIRS